MRKREGKGQGREAGREGGREVGGEGRRPFEEFTEGSAWREGGREGAREGAREGKTYRVELHGAGAEGDHGGVEGEVLVLQLLQVPEHLSREGGREGRKG